MPQVREFRSTNDYQRWLREAGSTVRVLATTSSKRWSLATGFLGDAKTITVTFEPAADAAAAPSTKPHLMGVVVAPKPVRFLGAPDVTKFSSVFAPDGESVEVIEHRAGFTLVRRAAGQTGWLPEAAVRATGEVPSDLKDCPRCAETVKRAAKVCRFCGHDFERTALETPPS